MFVVSPTVPLTLVNANFANVQPASASRGRSGTNGATLEAQSLRRQRPDHRRDRVRRRRPRRDARAASDQFAIQSAALTVTKAQTVIDDGFGSASPRAIPDAVVEYTIMVANTSTTTAADGLAISDPIPGQHDVPTGALRRPSDVAITGGAAATCIAETPADTNADGCFRNAAATSSSAARRSAASRPAAR